MSAIPKSRENPAIPSAEELVQRARAMIPTLRAQADAVEQARRVPNETIQAFVDAGFFKILQPRRWGGWEMNPEVFWRVLMELGRGCSSSAWNMMILGVHQWEFGLMPDQAAADVWGKDDKVIIASSYPPVGKVTRVDGGYMLEGRWPTSSGTDHGDWAFLGGNISNAAGQPIDRYSFLVSRKDYEIIDDWHVFGLCGTGSKSLQLKGPTFVPAHRAHSMLEYGHSDRGTEYYHPFSMIFFGSVSSVMVGFGQAAIDIFTEQMKSRINNVGMAVAQSPYVRDRLANAVVKVSSARARLLQMLAETRPAIEARQLVDMPTRLRHMAEIAHVGRDIEAAVLLLYKATGAKGIFTSQPLQRVLRDVLAGANHVTQNADDLSGALGGYMLTGDLPPLTFNRPEAAAA